MTCPKCGANKAHRSHRSGWRDRFLALFGRTPYRCHGCNDRFYAYLGGAKSSKMRTVEERRIMELRRKIRWKHTRRYLVAYVLAGLVLLGIIYQLMQQTIHTE